MQLTPQTQAGFTLIELMIVTAIIGILASVALPAYSNYVIRAKVSEGMILGNSFKTPILESFYMEGEMPSSNEEINLPVADSFNTKYVQSAGLSCGVVEVIYSIEALGDNNKLEIVPCAESGIVQWICKSADTNGIDEAFLPPSCQGNTVPKNCKSSKPQISIGFGGGVSQNLGCNPSFFAPSKS